MRVGNMLQCKMFEMCSVKDKCDELREVKGCETPSR